MFAEIYCTFTVFGAVMSNDSTVLYGALESVCAWYGAIEIIVVVIIIIIIIIINLFFIFLFIYLLLLLLLCPVFIRRTTVACSVVENFNY